MLITWSATEPLATTGLQQHILADGTCALLWAKGYFFDPSGQMHYDDEIVDWLVGQLPGNSLQDIILRMNGCYSLLIVYPAAGRVELGVDRIAALPVYIQLTPSQLAISDNFWTLSRQQGPVQYDPIGLAGMLLLGHTNGPHTMLKNIEIPLPGSIYTFTVTSHFHQTRHVYWVNAYRPQPAPDYKKLRSETAEMLASVFNRYATAIQKRGWTGEVPLSGGLDSRLAAGLLYQTGVPVKAFSYGPPGNNESQTSAQVARALSIPHRNTIIDDPRLFSPQVIECQTKLVGAQSRFTTGIGARLALTDYDPNRVFITGHPSNLPTGQVSGRGSNLLRSACQATQYMLNNVGVPILDTFAQQIMPSIWHPRLKQELYAALPFQEDDSIGSFEGWLYYFHVSNLLLLEMRIYEQFGRWLLPYLDYELVDFYNAVPLKHRYLRRLHVDAVCSHLFVGDLAPLSEIRLSGETRLAVPAIPCRDRLLMALPPSLAGDLYLLRHTRSVQAARQPGKVQHRNSAWGPDPLEYWWQQVPGYREQILAEFTQWDGLGGMIDTSALLGALRQPMHPLFIRFVLATMLTLKSFQRLAETQPAGSSPSWGDHE